MKLDVILLEKTQQGYIKNSVTITGWQFPGISDAYNVKMYIMYVNSMYC